MAPVDVLRVTHGAIWGFGIPWCRTIPTSAIAVVEKHRWLFKHQ